MNVLDVATDDEDEYLYSEETLDVIVEAMRVLMTFITKARFPLPELTARVNG